MAFTETPHITVKAPDAAAAFALEARLAPLHAHAVEHGGVWCVELQPPPERLDELVAALRRWLHELPTLPLGAGYDEGSLEHEP